MDSVSHSATPHQYSCQVLSLQAYLPQHPCLGFPLSLAAPPAAAVVSGAWLTPAARATAAMASMARERLGLVLAAEKALKRVFAVDV